MKVVLTSCCIVLFATTDWYTITCFRALHQDPDGSVLISSDFATLQSMRSLQKPLILTYHDIGSDENMQQCAFRVLRELEDKL